MSVSSSISKVFFDVYKFDNVEGDEDEDEEEEEKKKNVLIEFDDK